MTNQKNEFPLVAKIINGGIAGVVGTTCIFPLDLVKTRLQNQRIGPNGEKMYANMIDCFLKTYHTEGFRGMYRGSAVTIILVAPEKSIKLAGNDMFRCYLTKKDGTLPIIRQMLAGGLAGGFQTVLTTPIELLKIQLQDAGRTAAIEKAAGKDIKKLTARSIAVKLIRERGILGLYKGIEATAARDILFSLAYFPLFAAVNDLGPRRADGSGEAVTWWPLIGGLTAGSIAAVSVTPMDVVKTRMQLLNKSLKDGACVGLGKCMRETYKNEGWLALFKGGLCRMMVIAPLYGIAQLIYFLCLGEAIVAYFHN